MGSSGKSGALFYFTKDKKYILKSISHREFKILIGQKFLKDYHRFMSTNSESLMTRFFGAYRFRYRNPEET